MLNHTQPGTLSQNEKTELMQNLWNQDYQRLLEGLKKDILSGPTLARPYPSRRFYINTDWYMVRMGAVLLQVNVSEEAIKSY